MLASGWQDGTIQVWAISRPTPKEDQVVHSGAVCLIKWTPTGHRLITGDRVRPTCVASLIGQRTTNSFALLGALDTQNGVVGVWKPDGRGRLTPIIQYAKMGPITHCVFCNVKDPEPANKT